MAVELLTEASAAAWDFKYWLETDVEESDEEYEDEAVCRAASAAAQASCGPGNDNTPYIS